MGGDVGDMGMMGGCAMAGGGMGSKGGGKGLEPDAKRPRPAGTEPRPDVAQIIGSYRGVIKIFNSKNGFGFIESAGLKEAGYPNDVFLHRNQVGDCQVGQQVMFTAYLNKKGQPQSMDLQILQPGM